MGMWARYCYVEKAVFSGCGVTPFLTLVTSVADIITVQRYIY